MSSKHRQLKWSEWDWDDEQQRYYRYAKDKKGELIWDFKEADEIPAAKPRAPYDSLEGISETIDTLSINDESNYTTSASTGGYASSPPGAPRSKAKEKASDSGRTRPSSSTKTSLGRTSTKDRHKTSSSSRNKDHASRGSATSSKYPKPIAEDESRLDDEADLQYPDEAPPVDDWPRQGSDDYSVPSTEPAAETSRLGHHQTSGQRYQDSEDQQLYHASPQHDDEAHPTYQTAPPSRQRLRSTPEEDEESTGSYRAADYRSPVRGSSRQSAEIRVSESSTTRDRHGKRRVDVVQEVQVPELTAAGEPAEEDADADYQVALKMSQDEYYAHQKAGDSSASSAVYDEPEEEEEEEGGSRTPRAASPQHVPDIRGNMGGELGDEEALDPRYRVEPSGKFSPGEVFKVLWSEPQGARGSNQKPLSIFTDREEREYYGQRFYVSFRRFVVIANDEGHCTCVPVLTYGGKGCNKSGAKPTKHGVIYQEGRNPHTLKNEPKLGFRPVAMHIEAAGEKLARESRINYAKLMTIEHNVKVFFIGRIADEDWQTVVNAVDICWRDKKKARKKRH